MENKKKKFRVSGKLILNIAVLAITIGLIVYFFVSEDGMIDLLSKPDSFNVFWLIAALLVYDSNILLDGIVTLIFLRMQYKKFRFADALKVAFVGVFFGAITPSNTGGQPMQLYLLSKKKVSVGFGSACMTQKFIVYQIINTVISLVAVFTHFEYFQSAFTGFWSALFIVLGFTTQLLVTALFLIISFCKRLTGFLMRLIFKLMKKLKFIKNPEGKMQRLYDEVEMFHQGNREMLSHGKEMALIYLVVFLQILTILSVPYFIYLSFGMPQTAIESGQTPLNIIDVICIQSFVLFTSNLVPLPGASGGAELAFKMYFGSFFNVGGVKKIKPAILLWRFVTYYGAIIISAPFSYFTRGRKAERELKEKQKEK